MRMAFQIRELSVLGYANGFTLWHYASGLDTLGQVAAPGYFAEAEGMLEPNHLVILVAADGVRTMRVLPDRAGPVLGFPDEEGRYLLQLCVPAANAPSVSHVAVPFAGTVTGLRAVLDAATTLPLLLTARVGLVPITGGAIAIPPSPAGTAFAATPLAQNRVEAGQVLAIAGDGGGGTAAPASVMIEITRL
jgi:hypothetical protein